MRQRVDIAGARVEPAVPVALLEDDRHPVVERRECVVGVRGHDRARSQPLTVGIGMLLIVAVASSGCAARVGKAALAAVLPRCPQPGERHRLTVPAVNEHPLLTRSPPLPLVEALGWYETAMPPKSAFVGGPVRQRLRAGGGIGRASW